jgi:plastocyanin
MLGAAGVTACGAGGGSGGSTATTSSSTGEHGPTSSAATSSTSGASSSSGGLVNGCDPNATTLTTGNATMSFPTTAAPMQYAPNCVKIKAGSMVTWNGDFSMHPLAPEGTGNPIMATSTGMTASFTFTTAGTYGFHCMFHPTVMNGAIIVQ